MINPFTVLVRQLQSGDVVLAISLFLFTSWGAYHLLRLGGLLRHRWAATYAGFAWQIGVLLGLEQAYELMRGQIPHETDIAMVNAYRVLDLEWRHGFFVEARIERFFLHFHVFMTGIDLFYIVCHVGVTIGTIVWIYTRRREHYPFLRNLLMVTTAIALVVFYVYPTAPPRLLTTYGFVDPVQLHHFVDAGGAQPDSYTYNPYAAMPSLHVGYAIVMSWSLFVAERQRLVRTLAVVYPFFMAAVVIISANHWVLDVIGAFITVGIARVLLYAGARVRVAAQERYIHQADHALATSRTFE